MLDQGREREEVSRGGEKTHSLLVIKALDSQQYSDTTNKT